MKSLFLFNFNIDSNCYRQHNRSMLSYRYMLPALMCVSAVYAETLPEDALSTAFNIAPVHWDKNIAVVDICGAPVEGMSDILQWPETTGELLKLMDALKYEYETRCFQCVVFSMDAATEGTAAQRMLAALSECVTVCDMLRIPLRIAIRKGEKWVELAPTYTTQNAAHLMLGADGRVRFYEAEDTLQFTDSTVAEAASALKAAAEQGTVVNLFWKPAPASYAAFVELVELCNDLNVEYALMLQP